MKLLSHLILLSILLFTTCHLYAQNNLKRSRHSLESFVPSYFELKETQFFDPENIDSWFSKLMELDAELELKLLGSEEDQLGMIHYKYVQQVNSYPVFGTKLILHTKDMQVISGNGYIFSDLKIYSNIVLTEQEALKKALDVVSAESYMWENEDEEDLLKSFYQNPESTYFPKAELVYINPNHDFKSPLIRLAYVFDIYAREPLSRAKYYVDAETGEILFVQQIIHNVNVPGKANTKYSGIQYITVDSIAQDSFILRESTRGNGIETYNMQNGTSYAGSIDFSDHDNYWDNYNTQQDEIATDAHWGTEMTYDYYWDKFGRNSIDNNGFKLVSYVHYATNYANAFWNGQWMTYGDGNSSMNPLVSVDIIGHEITHGLTSNTADLIYEGQSGALNEGFSDIFGNMIEHYAKPGQFDWSMGENTGNTLRSMANPKNYGDPATMKGDNWVTTEGCVSSSANDYCGVHINSTVNSHWFYLLANGGKGTNDLGDAYDFNGIGIDKSSAIAFRSLTIYLLPSSDFYDARFYSIKAAADLYGECSAEVDAVINAWYAVGVGDSTRSIGFESETVSRCSPPLKTEFKNLSDAYENFYWDFGDGDTSTELHPVHEYTEYGNFTVKMIASGKCGTDSIVKESFIEIDSSIPCVFYMAASDQHDTIDLCAGKLYDDGGPSDDYTGNHDASVTIAPTGASKVILFFRSFAYEGDCDCDWIYIYDGPSSSSPLIGKYSGFDLPEGGVIESSGGAITIRQYTDPLMTYAGFELDWYCFDSTSIPFVDFEANATESCDGEISFESFIFNDPVSWEWDFGDGTTSTEKNPVHIYKSNGTYTVKLTATNSFGSQTEVKTDMIYINRPTAPVVQNVENCGSASVQMIASGSGELKWYESDSASSPIFTGDTFQTPVLSQTTSYFVENMMTPASQKTGLEEKELAPGGYYNGSSFHALIFDCYKEVTLKSVKIYASEKGSRTIVLKAADGTTLQDTTIDITSLGEQRVDLNFSLPVASNLQLGCEATAYLYRNTSGVEYPIILPDILSIHKTTATDMGYEGYYYFFYDWEIQEPACISNRMEATAFINTGIPVAAFSYVTYDSLVVFTNNSTDGNSFYWDFGDGTYDSVHTNPSHTYQGTGIYHVSLKASNACGNHSITSPIDLSSNIKEILIHNFNVYPIPANEKLFYTFDSRTNSQYRLRIISLLGHVIFEKDIRVAASVNQGEIDVQKLGKGVFLIQLLNKDSIVQKKIIIE